MYKKLCPLTPFSVSILWSNVYTHFVLFTGSLKMCWYNHMTHLIGTLIEHKILLNLIILFPYLFERRTIKMMKEESVCQMICGGRLKFSNFSSFRKLLVLAVLCELFITFWCNSRTITVDLYVKWSRSEFRALAWQTANFRADSISRKAWAPSYAEINIHYRCDGYLFCITRTYTFLDFDCSIYSKLECVL